MITASTWQRELRDSVSSVGELLDALGLDPRAGPHLDWRLKLEFPVRVPRSFVSRMKTGDWSDPLLLQVLPLGAELDPVAGFVADPLGEAAARRAPGLLQKYHGRALLVATESCAVHCRYCFRREFPYDSHRDEGSRWSAALEELAADSTVNELILSGGDPLSLATSRLEWLGRALQSLPHIRRLRLHTRLPVVLPSRVDQTLVDWLRGLGLQTVVVLHANHANEVDAEVGAACARLRCANVVLLNQSVLLRGVNDSEDALAALSESLFAAGVLPYYLHLLDRVSGTAHFEVDECDARRLVGGIAARLPGYLVPRLVREMAGAAAKLAVLPEFCEPGPVFTAKDAAVGSRSDVKIPRPNVAV